jgi:hypothetical protein
MRGTAGWRSAAAHLANYQETTGLIASDVAAPMLHRVLLPMVPHSWLGRSVGSKIHIFTCRSNRPAIQRGAVSKVCAAADRGVLRK